MYKKRQAFLNELKLLSVGKPLTVDLRAEINHLINRHIKALEKERVIIGFAPFYTFDIRVVETRPMKNGVVQAQVAFFPMNEESQSALESFWIATDPENMDYDD